ncbi:MAG: helix-turn-helix transcriptional regulator [Bacillota bacterium]|nr:helix-turn-helix transcriptional regulator [Bacillota bacterium]
MSKENIVKLIDSNSFIDNLEKRLILKNGKKEHEHLKSKYEKELELISAISMTRKSKNISQKEIGSKLGVTQQRISQIERNSKSMTLPILIDFIEALDLEVEIKDKNTHKKICRI